MSRPKLAIDLPTDALRIVRWEDPVLDAIGHDPRSSYVERFWLSLLGPSTTFLIRRIAAALEVEPGGFDLHLEDTAKAIGLGLRGGMSGPFYRALARTGQFHITKASGAGELAARTRLQTLTRHQVDRLPLSLQAEHAEWVASTEAVPDAEQRRTRARRLALSLLELGETDEATELQLHRWKIHPSTAHEALRWARGQRSDEPLASASAVATGPRATTGAPRPPIPPPLRPRPVYGPADDAA
ncbi:hypothetical protein [Aquihabitans sp. McL0605]|uniref:hypothetical protein n=1 Tax=Aquihabitans sp. McL0605 TaxID=3415671 RepID=UPI003CFB4E96